MQSMHEDESDSAFKWLWFALFDADDLSRLQWMCAKCFITYFEDFVKNEPVFHFDAML